MADYLNRNDVLEVFNDIHPLDYNAQAYLAEIEKLPVVETDKWISTAERQPEESGAYLCRTAKRVYVVVNYSKRHNMWNAFDSDDEPKHAIEVTHWMYIPEPPEVMEAKHGRWERVDYGNGCYNYHCSSCRHIPRENIRSNYCPNCGADMRGGADDGIL